MSLRCVQAGTWIDQRQAGLGEAERLRLEHHLATCAECAAKAQALDRVIERIKTVTSPVGERARRRVVNVALSRALDGGEAVVAPSVSPVRVPPLAWIGGGVMAAAVVAWLMVTASEARPVTTAAKPVAGDAVAVATAQDLAAAAQDAVEPVVFAATEPQQVSVDGAVLSLGDDSVVTWDATQATVALGRGRVRAQVASRAGKSPLRVVTQDFVVVVVGTDFEVRSDGVVVHEGVVRIEQRDGTVLREALRAGEQWTHASPTTAAEVVASVERVKVSASARPAVTVSQALAAARARLAMGDVGGARAALHAARVGGAGRPERAEADTLLAECSQAEGKVAQAITLYRKVAAAYGDLAAGDNAAYAAARLSVGSSDVARTRTLLREYLAEHPRGRFVTEVRRSLEAIGGTGTLSQ